MPRETESLARNIEHIKCIVGQQLAGARGDTRGAKIVERVTLEELFDDAADVLQSTLATGQHVKLVREPGAVAIATDRHKVFQIVMNLLANARDAVAARPGAGCVTLRGPPSARPARRHRGRGRRHRHPRRHPRAHLQPRVHHEERRARLRPPLQRLRGG